VKGRVRTVAIVVAVVLIGLAVVLALNVGKDPRADANRSQLLGEESPAYDLPLLDGQRVTSEGQLGTTVVINFWNSWCIPCRQEHPALVEWWDRHRDDDSVTMLGIVREDTKRAVERYVRDEDVTWPVAMDPGGRAALAFGTRGQPETYVISPSGIVVASQYGPVTVANLDAMVAAAEQVG
jgi:cytochrome c biogenesis protein CcmG/thiol:disulfide interchange protein DsbE